LAGGGWHNPVIYHELVTRLEARTATKINVLTATSAGWNNDALEAQLCAYLAVRSLYQLPISMPSITRVPEPLTGGVTHTSSKGVTPGVAKLLFPG
jgi:anhydro-N-acetylmuramic acid kinase